VHIIIFAYDNLLAPRLPLSQTRISWLDHDELIGQIAKRVEARAFIQAHPEYSALAENEPTSSEIDPRGMSRGRRSAARQGSLVVRIVLEAYDMGISRERHDVDPGEESEKRGQRSSRVKPWRL
jgi:hypothetical protein